MKHGSAESIGYGPAGPQSATRPEVASQLIREYIYLYGAVSPNDGTCVYLIMPTSSLRACPDRAQANRRPLTPGSRQQAQKAAGIRCRHVHDHQLSHDREQRDEDDSTNLPDSSIAFCHHQK